MPWSSRPSTQDASLPCRATPSVERLPSAPPPLPSPQARTRGRSARRNFHSVRSSAVLLQQTLRRRVKRREAARLAAEAAAAAAAAAEVPEDAELAGQAARLRAEVDALQAEAEPD